MPGLLIAGSNYLVGDRVGARRLATALVSAWQSDRSSRCCGCCSAPAACLGAAHAQPRVPLRGRVPAGLAVPSEPRASRRSPQPSLTRVALIVLCTLSLFHWAHFRYTLYDGLQIKHLNEVINLLCYGGAIVGSVVAAYLMLLVL